MAQPILAQNQPLGFETFFNDWFSRHEQLRDQLVAATAAENSSSDEQLVSLIEQVKAHLLEYTENRHQHAVEESVLEILSPTWLTSFEVTSLWFGGFKPTIVFQLLNQSVNGRSTEQKSEMESIRRLAKDHETLIENEMAVIQESLATPGLSDMLRRLGRGLVGEDMDMEMREAATHLKSRLLDLVNDNLRRNTWTEVMDVLNLRQRVKLLTAGIHFHIKMRNLGLERQTQFQPQSEN